jgi:uncharacterized protein (TIGR00290 family)
MRSPSASRNRPDAAISASPSRPRAAVSWSGGKDSYTALSRARSGYDVVAMLTMFDEAGSRSRSHGLRPEIIDAQAERLDLRPFAGRCSWATYDEVFSTVLDQLAASGITHVIFGDILFEEHRRWAEDISSKSGLVAVEPLWGSSTDVLFDEWVSSGNKALIVSARAALLDETWPGRQLDRSMADVFAGLGVDACGERGEFHTLVTDGSLFSSPLQVLPGELIKRSDYWALDFVLARSADAGKASHAAGR